VALLLGLLAACSTAPPRATVYDLGPGATRAEVSNRLAPLPSVVLAEVEAPVSLENTAVLYRLGYADAQQLRPYAQARWSMAPAQLLRARLRAALGQRRSVLTPLDAVAPGTLTLRLELEEFSQWFDTATSSAGLVRVRATLGRTGSPGSPGSSAIPAKPVAQTAFVLQSPSSSADAAGGVHALAQATDALVLQLDSWLQQTAAAEAAAP
jgi:cholesterol transport system auxiliary component